MKLLFKKQADTNEAIKTSVSVTCTHSDAKVMKIVKGLELPLSGDDRDKVDVNGLTREFWAKLIHTLVDKHGDQINPAEREALEEYVERHSKHHGSKF